MKVPALLDKPPIITLTVPVVAPEGTLTEMEVLVQLLIVVAVTPLN